MLLLLFFLFFFFFGAPVAVPVEGGKVHYLTDLASDHKEMVLQSPVAMERDGLTWSNSVQALVQVRMPFSRLSE